MKSIKITINGNYRYNLLDYLYRLNEIYIKPSDSQIKNKFEEEDQFRKKIIKMTQSLKELLNKLQINESNLVNVKIKKNERIRFEANDLLELINHVFEEIDFFLNRIYELEKNIIETKKTLEKIKIIEESYKFFEKLKLTADSFKNLNKLKFQAFITSLQNLSNLKAIFTFSKFPSVYQTYSISNDRIVFYVIYPNNKEDDLKERIKTISVEEVPIFLKYLTHKGINFTRINNEIEIITNTLTKYKKELERMKDYNSIKFSAINETVQNIKNLYWANRQFEELSPPFLNLKFYVPKSRYKEIIGNFNEIFKDTISIEAININKKEVFSEIKKSEKILKLKKDDLKIFPLYLDANYSIIKFKVATDEDIIIEDIDKEIETKTTKENIDKAKTFIHNEFY